VPVRLLVGTKRHPSEVTDGQRELLEEKIRDFTIESVRGAGQFIQEEQPAAVLAAMSRLEQAAR
jgi:hypothetical protein